MPPRRCTLKKIILLGPPGAGKGTQAARVAGKLGVSLISSGDLFRGHLADQTPLGLKARAYINSGELVPDELTIAMVMGWVNSPDQSKGFVLDGFPRSLGQAEALDEAMRDRGGIDRVLYIDVPNHELIRRLGGRSICTDCQAPYHATFSPPVVEGVCDKCGGCLYQREDDRPKAVTNRLLVYEEHTAPLVEYYLSSLTLTKINGDASIDAVWKALEAAVS